MIIKTSCNIENGSSTLALLKSFHFVKTQTKLIVCSPYTHKVNTTLLGWPRRADNNASPLDRRDLTDVTRLNFFEVARAAFLSKY